MRISVILAVGVAASLAWSARVAALDAERARWGELTPVLVVVEPVDSGAPVAASVELRQLPLAMVPANSLVEVPAAALAKADLYIDEILVGDRITHADGLGPAPGTVALTLSTVASAPVIDRGDLIDVWTVDSANLSSRRIAESVEVLFVASGEITIAVPTSQVADTTAAALRPVVIALVG